MSTDDSQVDGPSIWAQPRFLIAAVVVALIALLGVALTVTGPANGNDDPAPRAAPTPSSPAPSVQSGSGSGCKLEQPADQTIPVTAPANTTWELVGGVAAPTAPETVGPGQVDDGLRSCFARSPVGALYAAVNFVATTSRPDLRLRAVEELTASGEGRTRAIAALTAEGEQPASTPGAQIAGFAFRNYDEQGAVVDLAVRAGTGGQASLGVSLRWEDGDWKVILPPSGEAYDGIQPIPDLTGYVPWSGA